MNHIITSLMLLWLVAADARVAVVSTPLPAEQAVVQLRQLSQLEVANASQTIVTEADSTAFIEKAGVPDSPADVAPAAVGTATNTWKKWLQDKIRFSAWYRSLSRAVRVAQHVPQMSTLLAAVNAAGVAGPLSDSDTAWTILAPTNDAFEDLLKAQGMTAQALLGNKDLLVKVLSYHVIPTPATSNDLVSGTAYPTALKIGNVAQTVLVTKLSSGAVRIKGNPLAACNTAKVTVANIRAGKSIIHIIDTVLLPP